MLQNLMIVLYVLAFTNSALAQEPSFLEASEVRCELDEDVRTIFVEELPEKGCETSYSKKPMDSDKLSLIHI